MKCSTFRDLIQQHYYDDVSPQKNASLRQHVIYCPECKKLLTQEEKISHALSSLPQMKPSSAMQSKIWQGITDRQTASYRQGLLGKRLSWGVALTAMVIIAATPLLINQGKKSEHKQTISSKALPDHQANPQRQMKKESEAQALNVVILQEIAQPKQTTNTINDISSKKEKNQIAKKEFSEKYYRKKTLKNQKEFFKQMVADKPQTSQKAKIVKHKKTVPVNEKQQPIHISSNPIQTTAESIVTIQSEEFRIFKNKINLNLNEITRVTLSINEQAKVNIQIYAKTGRLVQTIVDKSLAPGQYEWYWDGKSSSNGLVGSGIYLMVCKIKGKKPEKFKIIVIK